MNETSDFIQEYFVNPLAHPEAYPPFNPVNTIVYAAVALLAAYAIYEGVKRLGIKIDNGFFYAVLPFVFVGGIMRVLADAGILPRQLVFGGVTLYPFITPGVYVTTFLILVLCFGIARLSKNLLETAKNLGIVMTVLVLLPLLPLLKNWLAFAFIVLLALLSLGVFMVLWARRGLQATNLEKILVFSQSFDGAATFTGLFFFGYWEQHVVGNAIISLFGTPLAFFVVKCIFSFAAVEVIRREVADEKQKTFLLLLITIFGLAPGTRDSLRLLAGV